MVFNPLKIFAKDKKPNISPIKEHLTEEVKVKPLLPRGPGGKFISLKKPEEPKEKPKTKRIQAPKGPFMVPFGGMEIRRFYASGKWYFAIEDILGFGHSDPPIKPIAELKETKELGKILEKNIKNLKEVDCCDSKGCTEIIRETVRTFKAEFPGPIISWLEDTSKLPFTITEPSKTQVTTAPQENPSDRGR